MSPELAKTERAEVRFPAGAPPLQWAALSDRGRQRENNEDSWGAFALGEAFAPLATGLPAWPSGGALLVVSDGMGGASAGEVASQFCVERFSREIQARALAADASAAMTEAIMATHAALVEKSRSNPEWKGMGATLSALWLRSDGSAVLGHVGDSRVYGCRDAQWRQWTDDHTLGEGLVRRGGMTPQAAARFKFRSLLEQVMGGDGRVLEPQVVASTWQAGDAFALCSDGLYRPLDEELEAQFNAALRQPTPEVGVRGLIDEANSAGGPDNITIVLARVARPETP